jgi:hypothetical protein
MGDGDGAVVETAVEAGDGDGGSAIVGTASVGRTFASAATSGC